MSAPLQTWNDLDPPWRAAFDEAWASWCAGCFGIGSVIVNGEGAVIARGRNRVLEQASQAGVLAQALIAHAEMNALAMLNLDEGTGEDLRLYTTMEPCLMCASTIVMVRFGEVHYAAGDPMFDGLEDMLRAHPYSAERLPRRHGPLGGPIETFAGLLPLVFNLTWTPQGRWVRMHQALFPDHHRVGVDVMRSGVLSEVARRGGTTADALEALWADLVQLAG